MPAGLPDLVFSILKNNLYCKNNTCHSILDNLVNIPRLRLCSVLSNPGGPSFSFPQSKTHKFYLFRIIGAPSQASSG